MRNMAFDFRVCVASFAQVSMICRVVCAVSEAIGAGQAMRKSCYIHTKPTSLSVCIGLY